MRTEGLRKVGKGGLKEKEQGKQGDGISLQHGNKEASNTLLNGTGPTAYYIAVCFFFFFLLLFS